MTVAPASYTGLVTPRLLVVSAVLVAGLAISLILFAAGDTLGYDFRAYLEAARRLLHGTSLYDPGVDVAGGFAIYLYPPPFAVALVPLALLPGTLAPTLAWTALIIAALLLAIAALPVRPWVRWTLLLVAGLSWPVLYTLKLGQVGTLLLLCFAVAWRCIDRPVPLGLSIASGTLVKLQPVLLLPWALAVGRWRAATSSVVALAAVCIASLLVVGTSAWADYVALLRRVNDPVSTPHTVSPGAVAYQSGLSLEAATLFQWLAVAGVVAITLHAWFRRDPGRASWSLRSRHRSCHRSSGTTTRWSCFSRSLSSSIGSAGGRGRSCSCRSRAGCPLRSTPRSSRSGWWPPGVWGGLERVLVPE